MKFAVFFRYLLSHDYLVASYNRAVLIPNNPDHVWYVRMSTGMSKITIFTCEVLHKNKRIHENICTRYNNKPGNSPPTHVSTKTYAKSANCSKKK